MTSALNHLRFVLELTFVTLDHEHTPAEWGDWSVFEISLANKAEGGKHTSKVNGVFGQYNHAWTIHATRADPTGRLQLIVF